MTGHITQGKTNKKIKTQPTKNPQTQHPQKPPNKPKGTHQVSKHKTRGKSRMFSLLQTLPFKSSEQKGRYSTQQDGPKSLVVH